ncbi:MAG: hypothetical protein V1918_01880 [Planctomycetota bacterium]
MRHPPMLEDYEEPADGSSILKGWGPVPVLWRFSIGVFFGFFVDLFFVFLAGQVFFAVPALLAALLLIPPAWGFLSIFFLERMMLLARDLLESIVHLRGD